MDGRIRLYQGDFFNFKSDFECDFDGLYGVGPNTFYFPIQNEYEGVRLCNFLKSDVYKKLILSTKINRQFVSDQSNLTPPYNNKSKDLSQTSVSA